MRRLLIQIIIGVAGIWLADRFIDGVIFTGTWPELLLVGTVLGLINSFLKPLINLVTLPVRLLTLGLFSFVINILIIELTDVLFAELDIIGLAPLFWATILVWALNFIIPTFLPKRMPRRISRPKGNL